MVVLAALAALAACTGGEPVPESAPAPVVTPAAATAPAAPPFPAATPPAADAATPAAAAPGAIDRDTSWREVSDTLTAAERTCIRGELGPGAETLLAGPVIRDGPTEEWEAALFSCLEPATARAVFLGALTVVMAEEGVELGGEELACVRAWVSDLDVAAAVASSLDADADLDEITIGLMSCVPELFLSLVLEGMGADLRDVSGDELACLREWALETDAENLSLLSAIATGEEAATVRFALGFLACAPALFISTMTGEAVELDAAAEDCLRGLVAGIDTADPPDQEEMFGGLLSCVLALADVPGGEAPGEHDDDHADTPDGATPILAGVGAEGVVGSLADVDYFAFAAERGVLYQIDVAPRTLADPVAVLYDAEGREVGFSDDRADSLAPRIYWEATHSGPHYIEVWGYDTGSYTVTVVAR